MSWHKERVVGHKQKSTEGQAKSASRKRANQAANRALLSKRAAAAGITVEQLQSRMAREKTRLVAEGQRAMEALARESESRRRYW